MLKLISLRIPHPAVGLKRNRLKGRNGKTPDSKDISKGHSRRLNSGALSNPRPSNKAQCNRASSRVLRPNPYRRAKLKR